MDANKRFSTNLNALMEQLHISGAQLARALNVDPSLISRYRKNGFGERHASAYALSIGKYLMTRQLSPENAAWLGGELRRSGASGPITAERIAQWLYPAANVPADAGEREAFPNLLLLDSFQKSVSGQADDAPAPPAGGIRPAYDIRAGRSQSAAVLREALSRTKRGAEISVFLSSESMSAAASCTRCASRPSARTAG